MYTITPLSQVSRDAIRDMAKAAVNNGTPLADANPFDVGTSSHAHFEFDYHAYDRELAAVD